MKKIFIGLLVGIISGLFASGGGIILVPIFRYFFNLSEKEARATSLFCIFSEILSTSIVYISSYYINL